MSKPMFNPNAFTVFGYPIRWYGIAMALALLTAAAIAQFLLKKRGRPGEYVWDGLIWAAILGIIGARVGYVITSWSEFSNNLLSVFYINQGGLSFHGGIAGGILGCWLYFRRSPLRFIEVMDAAAPGVSVGIMLVRFIGNLSNGDILGFKVSPKLIPWAMNFPYDAYHEYGQKLQEYIPRHPTEIYGGIVGLILLIISLIVWFRKTTPGTNFYTFILSYSLVRSLIEEPFRSVPHVLIKFQNDTYGFGGITVTQWVSIPLIILGIYGIIAVRRKGKPADWDKKPEELKALARERRERVEEAHKQKERRRIMPESYQRRAPSIAKSPTEEKPKGKPFAK